MTKDKQLNKRNKNIIRNIKNKYQLNKTNFINLKRGNIIWKI